MLSVQSASGAAQSDSREHRCATELMNYGHCCSETVSVLVGLKVTDLPGKSVQLYASQHSS